MRAKETRQVRQKHYKMLLAQELLENPWIMAELETERQQALRLRPLIAAMGDLGEGSAHRLVALEEVTRTSGEDTQVRKVMQRRCVMCVRKALVGCQACHKPSEGIVAYLCRPYTGRDCATLIAQRPWRHCQFTHVLVLKAAKMPREEDGTALKGAFVERQPCGTALADLCESWRC
eukprot:scaffold619_cov368-Pavlova_lutheri.AAC.8